jgi:hypothetical protein
MAKATMPSKGGCAFLLCENVYCGRNLQIINTTCGLEKKVKKL